ncbi:uncharacterized protein [Haliotis cracherodii]|uniref:uncharacterized protein n=1 Tax=Haliotis cracherodii TaxID=6455 RepID=UPI0039ECACD8
MKVDRKYLMYIKQNYKLLFCDFFLYWPIESISCVFVQELFRLPNQWTHPAYLWQRPPQQAFHYLHPKAGKSGTALLCNADTKWRKQCQEAVKPTETSRHRFGGRFKVQLAVATTSDRCYRLILDIMELFSLGKLKEQKNTKVNTCLFLETVSFKDEATLYRKLTEFRNGEISKEEFNYQLKQIKQENKGTGNNKEAADVLALQEQLKEKDILIQELRTQTKF